MKNRSEIKPDQALTMLMKICSEKEMCSYDLGKKMEHWGIEEIEQKRILTNLEKQKFYSNRRYSVAFINDKVKLRKWGRIKIKYALKAKQIPEDIIDELLKGTEEVDYTDNLENMLNKKLRNIKLSESKLQKKARLYRFAVGRGFEPELIFRVLNKLVGD